MSDFGIRFDEVASVGYSITNNTTSHDSTFTAIANQNGEVVDYGAPGTAPTTEGYNK